MIIYNEGVAHLLKFLPIKKLNKKNLPPDHQSLSDVCEPGRGVGRQVISTTFLITCGNYLETLETS